MQRFSIRPLLVSVGLVSAGLAFGVALREWAFASSPIDVHKGATLVSFLPESVMLVSFTSRTGTATAQRSAPNSPFQLLITSADGSPPQRCSASADLQGHLAKLSTLSAKRGLSLKQRETAFPIQLGVLQIQDAILGAPAGPMMLFAEPGGSAAAVMFGGVAAELTLQVAELQWLESACLGILPSAIRQGKTYGTP